VKPPSESAISLGKDHYFSKYYDLVKNYSVPAALEPTIQIAEDDNLPEFWSGIIWWHRRRGPLSPTDDGWCCISVPFVTRSGHKSWTVANLDPLTLYPSVHCDPTYGGCGARGTISAGAWSDDET
jgi:hypothetical protein